MSYRVNLKKPFRENALDCFEMKLPDVCLQVHQEAHGYRVSAAHDGATGHRDDGGGRPAAAERRGEGAAALLPRHVAR